VSETARGTLFLSAMLISVAQHRVRFQGPPRRGKFVWTVEGRAAGQRPTRWPTRSRRAGATGDGFARDDVRGVQTSLPKLGTDPSAETNLVGGGGGECTSVVNIIIMRTLLRAARFLS